MCVCVFRWSSPAALKWAIIKLLWILIGLSLFAGVMPAAAFDVSAFIPASVEVEWVRGLICIQSYSRFLFVLAQSVERVIVFISQKCLSRWFAADSAWRRATAESAEWENSCVELVPKTPALFCRITAVKRWVNSSDRSTEAALNGDVL